MLRPRAELWREQVRVRIQIERVEYTVNGDGVCARVRVRVYGMRDW